MKNITIEEDIYNHLLNNTTEIGETASSILRRLLKLQTNESKTSLVKSDLDKILTSTDFIDARNVVGRFLVLLTGLHNKDPKGFAEVERIKGKGRLYFAKDQSTLEKGGTNVNPKRIPHTEYWVITTTPTDLKQNIIERVMKLSSYSAMEINKAKNAISN